jgi:hypothetical protein
MKQTYTTQNGSAIIYILIAIALLAALTASLMDSPSQQTQSTNRMKTLAEVKGQVDLIRSSVEGCVLKNPGGDINIPNASSEAEEGADHRYPIRPNSPYYDAAPAATIGAASDRAVRNIRCPGNPGDDKNHAMMFSGASGKFLPPAPTLFEDWQWYNGNDGVFFWTQTDKTDNFLTSALEKLDDEFGECEADVIDATGGAEALDSGSSIECPNTYTCFRVWLKMEPSTAVYPDTVEDTACTP